MAPAGAYAGLWGAGRTTVRLGEFSGVGGMKQSTRGAGRSARGPDSGKDESVRLPAIITAVARVEQEN